MVLSSKKEAVMKAEDIKRNAATSPAYPRSADRFVDREFQNSTEILLFYLLIINLISPTNMKPANLAV